MNMNAKKTFGSIAAFLALATIPPSAQGDVITDWNEIALSTLAAVQEARVPPATRVLAMVHVAMYDAANSADHRYSPYVIHDCAPRGTSPEVSAVLAAYTVLLGLYPEQKVGLDAALRASLDNISESRGKDLGTIWGTSVGNRILELRSHDGSNVTTAYNQTPVPGVWRPTPPDFTPAVFVSWSHVLPFTIENGSQFRAAPPPSIYRQRFRHDLEEVKSLGAADSITRTPDQTEIAIFWVENSFITWNHIAQVVAKGRNDLLQNARLFALLNFAEADGAITAFDSKYTYNFWRPVTAIQEGLDNRRRSIPPDPSWMPLRQTPAHPDYTSQHAVLGSAAATVLAFFFENDNIPFSVTTSSLPGVSRSFESFSEAAKENGEARIYVGFHFRTAVQMGLHQGRELAGWICDDFLVEDDDDN